MVVGVKRCGGRSVTASREMQSLGGHSILMEPRGRETSTDNYQEKGYTKTPPVGNQAILHSCHISGALGSLLSVLTNIINSV